MECSVHTHSVRLSLGLSKFQWHTHNNRMVCDRDTLLLNRSLSLPRHMDRNIRTSTRNNQHKLHHTQAQAQVDLECTQVPNRQTLFQDSESVVCRQE